MTDRISIENVRVTDKGVELKTSAAGKDYAQFTAMWSSSRKNRQTGETEYGPTRFMRVIFNGFKAEDVAAMVSPGDRVNVAGRVECFEWQSNNGPKEDWTIIADSVTLPVPRAGMHDRVNAFTQQQGGQQQGDPWGGAPQGGFTGAQGDQEPPF